MGKIDFLSLLSLSFSEISLYRVLCFHVNAGRRRSSSQEVQGTIEISLKQMQSKRSLNVNDTEQ